jgi:hypothetical protein
VRHEKTHPVKTQYQVKLIKNLWNKRKRQAGSFRNWLKTHRKNDNMQAGKSSQRAEGGLAMMNDMVTLPDEHLRYICHESDDTALTIHIESTNIETACPYCGTVSGKVHSRYTRKLQDLPIQGKKVNLMLANRKYFCINTQCGHKTFAEQFAFFEPNRLEPRGYGMKSYAWR